MPKKKIGDDEKNLVNEIFKKFGDEFFASRGKSSAEAIDTLHKAMDIAAEKRLPPDPTYPPGHPLYFGGATLSPVRYFPDGGMDAEEKK